LQTLQAAGRASELITYAHGELAVGPGLDSYVEQAGRGDFAQIAAAAAAVQHALGDALVRFLGEIREDGAGRTLCVGGGLFFNTYFNSVVRRSTLFDRVHVPVNPGNGGLAAGCALAQSRDARDEGRVAGEVTSPFLGPEFTNEQIKAVLDNCKLSYSFLEDWQLIPLCVDALARGELVGWYRGRMEWGPRALGNRSILANPLLKYTHENVNRFLKQRAPYRTYGLVVGEDRAGEFFDGPSVSPFMDCEFDLRDPERFAGACPSGARRLRVQTLSSEPTAFRRLLDAFGQLTGVPVLLNTSFNGFNEPIVCSPRDAVRVFYGSGLDVLAIGNFLLRK
jgi:carbamoyltransferase